MGTRGHSTFDDLLAEREILVADGAMGTALFELGLETGGSPELLNTQNPDLIARVHQGYVEAGADIILTNTFGGTRARLALHGLQGRVAELNQAAVGIARQVADRAGRTIVVAGSIGPTGELFEPLGPLRHEEGVGMFSEQVDALVEAGVDVLWIETISSWEELTAAVQAAGERDLPVVTTLSFDTNGHTMMGIAPNAVAQWWLDHQSAPAALGANCGIGPSDVVTAAAAIRTTAPDAIVVAKGNCGIPLYKDEALSYPSGPQDMAAYTELAIRAGARIVGACCGSTFDHIRVVRSTVDSGVSGQPPTLAEIAKRLGKVSDEIVRGPTRRNRRRSHAANAS